MDGCVSDGGGAAGSAVTGDGRGFVAVLAPARTAIPGHSLDAADLSNRVGAQRALGQPPHVDRVAVELIEQHILLCRVKNDGGVGLARINGENRVQLTVVFFLRHESPRHCTGGSRLLAPCGGAR